MQSEPNEDGIYEAKPAEVSVDGVRTRMPSVKEQIEWDQYLKSQKRGGPFKFAKIKPPGTAGR